MAVLDFEVEPQERDQWCWAAVAASVCQFYRDAPSPTQCALANQFLFPSEDCCQPGSGDDCNIPFAVDLALNQFGHLVQPTRGIVAFEELSAAISGNTPVVVRIIFSDLTAHFVVIVGCANGSNGQQIVKVADPSQASGNSKSMPYSDLVTNFTPGAMWDQTYFTAKRA